MDSGAKRAFHAADTSPICTIRVSNLGSETRGV